MDPSILSEEEELQPLSARYNSYPAPKNISPNINQIILFTITKSRFTLGSIGALSVINGSNGGNGGIGAVMAAMEQSISTFICY